MNAQLIKIESCILGIISDKTVITAIVIDMNVVIDSIVTIFNLIRDHIHNLYQEGQKRLLIKLPQDISHSDIFKIVKGICQGKEHPFL